MVENRSNNNEETASSLSYYEQDNLSSKSFNESNDQSKVTTKAPLAKHKSRSVFNLDHAQNVADYLDGREDIEKEDYYYYDEVFQEESTNETKDYNNNNTNLNDANQADDHQEIQIPSKKANQKNLKIFRSFLRQILSRPSTLDPSKVDPSKSTAPSWQVLDRKNSKKNVNEPTASSSRISSTKKSKKTLRSSKSIGHLNHLWFNSQSNRSGFDGWTNKKSQRSSNRQRAKSMMATHTSSDSTSVVSTPTNASSNVSRQVNHHTFSTASKEINWYRLEELEHYYKVLGEITNRVE